MKRQVTSIIADQATKKSKFDTDRVTKKSGQTHSESDDEQSRHNEFAETKCFTLNSKNDSGFASTDETCTPDQKAKSRKWKNPFSYHPPAHQRMETTTLSTHQRTESTLSAHQHTESTLSTHQRINITPSSSTHKRNRSGSSSTDKVCGSPLSTVKVYPSYTGKVYRSPTNVNFVTVDEVGSVDETEFVAFLTCFMVTHEFEFFKRDF